VIPYGKQVPVVVRCFQHKLLYRAALPCSFDRLHCLLFDFRQHPYCFPHTGSVKYCRRESTATSDEADIDRDRANAMHVVYSARRSEHHSAPLRPPLVANARAEVVPRLFPKAGIPRRRHRQRLPRKDPRRHVRHARFPEVIPMTS